MYLGFLFSSLLTTVHICPAITLFLRIVLAAFGEFIASWDEPVILCGRSLCPVLRGVDTKVISIPRSSLNLSVTTFCFSAGLATNSSDHNRCMLFPYEIILPVIMLYDRPLYELWTKALPDDGWNKQPKRVVQICVT